MPHLAPTEIAALAGILGELDYYQLLHLAADAKPSDIKRAYHDTSRTFHPDVNRHQDPEIRHAIDEIAKRIAEAYSILRNPRRRKAYDQQIETGSGVRMQLAQAQAAPQPTDGHHLRAGQRFFQRAIGGSAQEAGPQSPPLAKPDPGSRQPEPESKHTPVQRRAERRVFDRLFGRETIF